MEEEFSSPKNEKNVNETVSAQSVLVTAAFTLLHSADGILRNRQGDIKVGGQGVLKCVFFGLGCNNMLLGKGCLGVKFCFGACQSDFSSFPASVYLEAAFKIYHCIK